MATVSESKPPFNTPVIVKRPLFELRDTNVSKSEDEPVKKTPLLDEAPVVKRPVLGDPGKSAEPADLPVVKRPVR